MRMTVDAMIVFMMFIMFFWIGWLLARGGDLVVS
ncbi:hypothetical protein OPIT5_11530 [Opitutaceae bacterium TAV5]|nr:hypothetical protein OPIT5_11530 [Opitutaceae bacterium TAV5]